MIRIRSALLVLALMSAAACDATQITANNPNSGCGDPEMGSTC